MADVNGYTNNPHYVKARVESLISGEMDPVMMEVMSQLALHRPRPGKVQAFVLDVLKTGAKPFTPGPKQPDLPEYFESTVDPILQQLIKAVAVAEPDDVRAFLVETCTNHADLEAVVMGYGVRAVAPTPTPDGAGTRPPATSVGAGVSAAPEHSSGSGGGDTGSTVAPARTLRSGMHLGDHHVMVTLGHDDDGATFHVHCPRTNREAAVTVPASDEVLSTLLLRHGSMALYHASPLLELTEDSSHKLQLKWNPPKKAYRPGSCPVGAAGVYVNGRFLAVALREEEGGIVISAFCHHTRHSSYTRVPAHNKTITELLSKHGPNKAMYHVGPFLKLTEEGKGFDLTWVG